MLIRLVTACPASLTQRGRPGNARPASSNELETIESDCYFRPMNVERLRPGSGGEEDSWETLAEDLLGINLGQGAAGGPQIAPEDLPLDELESAPPAAEKPAPRQESPPQKRPAPESRGREPRPVSASEADELDDFGADLDLDDSQFESNAADDSIEEDESRGEVTGEAAGPQDDSEAAPGEGPSGESEADSYWDTLKNWQWSEEDEGSQDRPERRDRGGRPPRGRGRSGGGPRHSGRRERSGGRGERSSHEDRPRRSERSGERRRDERSEGRRQDRPPERPHRPESGGPPPRAIDEENDFGSGLLEDEVPSSAGRASTGRDDADEWNEPASPPRAGDANLAEPRNDLDTGEPSGEERSDERGPRRRRRRRRRSRSRRDQPEFETGREAPADEPVLGEDEESADESAMTEDEFAAAEQAEAAAEARGEGPRRRRRRRRRRPSDARPDESRRAPGDVDGDVDDDDEVEAIEPDELSLVSAYAADDDEDEGEPDAEGDVEGDEEALRVYRNVPTWEEAISYLLHKRPGEGRSRESESGGSRGPRGSGRDGGRRPERGDRPRD